jgi:hypothetical protein
MESTPAPGSSLSPTFFGANSLLVSESETENAPVHSCVDEDEESIEQPLPTNRSGMFRTMGQWGSSALERAQRNLETAFARQSSGRPGGPGAELEGRASDWRAGLMAELRRDFLPTDGVRGLTEEVVEWVHLIAHNIDQSLPFLRRWLQPAAAAAPSVPIAFEDDAQLPRVAAASETVEATVNRILTTAGRVLYGSRGEIAELSDYERDVLATFRRILTMIMNDAEQQPVVKRLLEQPDLVEAWLDRFLPAIERLTHGINSELARSVSCDLVDTLVITYPLDAIGEVDRDPTLDPKIKQQRVLEVIASRADPGQDVACYPLHPVITDNLAGDIATHDARMRQHFKEMLLRLIWCAGVREGEDPVAVRLSDRFLDEALETGAALVAGQLWEIVKKTLAEETIRRTLEKTVTDLFHQKSPLQSRQVPARAERPTYDGVTNYLPQQAREQLIKTLLPKLANDIGGTSRWMPTVGLFFGENTVVFHVNKKLDEILQPVGNRGDRRLRSDTLNAWLVRLEKHLHKAQLGRAETRETSQQEQAQPTGQLNLSGKLVNAILWFTSGEQDGIKKIQGNLERWLLDYRLVFDNILLKITDATMARVFPGITEQWLVDSLQRPLTASPLHSAQFRKIFAQPAAGWKTPRSATQLLTGEGPLLGEALLQDQTWETLIAEMGEDSRVTGLKRLQGEVTKQADRRACAELLELLEIAHARWPVHQALHLSDFCCLGSSLTRELREELGKQEPNISLASALVGWRQEGVPIVELTKRAHQWLFVQKILLRQPLAAELCKHTTEALTYLNQRFEGDVVRYFLSREQDASETATRAADALSSFRPAAWTPQEPTGSSSS